ncbi:hypothetical protein ACLOAU_09325 [Niabella sp. CJ426]|uniref:hypothetical protein n=1 Tax=Niabella sp. CJ426 TaxID=3393740 RepID=UPI003CFDEF59
MKKPIPTFAFPLRLKQNMKFTTGIQKLLPFGYLFLIVMGVLKESILYYQLGINIMRYSTITDILISPVEDLVSHPLVFAVVILMAMSAYGLPAYLAKRRDKNWVKKVAGLKSGVQMNDEESAIHFTNMFIKTLVFILLGFFSGIGVAEGFRQAKKIKTGDLNLDYTISFGNGKTEPVHLIGSNSTYCFYVTGNNKNIKIAPVGSIDQIELTRNRRLQ